MIDFHSHVLPGIDDGSDSVSTSLTMLEMWREQGIPRVCATPHFVAERTTPARFLQKRDEAFNELRAAAGDGGPELLLGAEVRFFDGISAADELPMLCLEGTQLLLIEMPFTRWTERMLGEITEICRRGLIPVAAHLERYLSFNPKKIIRRFMDMDILIQCNAEFFLERRTERKALALMREGRIHFLGSDAHNLTSRAPNLGPALALIEKKLGREAVERLLRVEEKAGFGRESVPQ
ncbi:MAG: capsular polysaccharide biosynthesis protein [Oscillospiraceae bacterium]|nr:capsular polysaccharide biosynthesis protein [Oscillospiraceae bacterium]